MFEDYRTFWLLRLAFVVLGVCNFLKLALAGNKQFVQKYLANIPER